MRVRLAAGAAGILVVVGAVSAFLLGSEPVITGTNTVEPFHVAVSVPSGARKCQRLPRIPSEARRVQLGVAPARGRTVDFRVTLLDSSGRISNGTASKAEPGQTEVSLSPPARGASHVTDARLCVANLGRNAFALAGEDKKTPAPPGGAGKGRPQGSASVIFVQPESASPPTRADTVVKRFGWVQSGASGTWALWLATLMAIGAVGLAIWWLVARSREDG